MASTQCSLGAFLRVWVHGEEKSRISLKFHVEYYKMKNVIFKKYISIHKGKIMNVGKIIRKMRRDREMSQEQLAKLIGITQATVLKWEHDKGDITFKALVKIAQIFNVPVKSFFEEDCTCKN